MRTTLRTRAPIHAVHIVLGSLGLLGLLVGGGSSSVLLAAEGTENQCVSCHQIERLPISLGHSFEEWKASTHGRSAVGCEKCHGGDPAAIDADAAHRGVLPTADQGSLVHPGRIAATCGSCHTPELAAYSDTVHAKQVKQHRQGATCFTCHGSMATSLPSPSELRTRCAVCHDKPVQAQAALAVLAAAKIQLYRTHRELDQARDADEEWYPQAVERFHDLEEEFAEVSLLWHTFATKLTLEKSRDLLRLGELLEEEIEVRDRMDDD